MGDVIDFKTRKKVDPESVQVEQPTITVWFDQAENKLKARHLGDISLPMWNFAREVLSRMAAAGIVKDYKPLPYVRFYNQQEADGVKTYTDCYQVDSHLIGYAESVLSDMKRHLFGFSEGSE